ncbi:phosphoribosylanthranilate isomerase [Novosphingobium sp. CF614]|uniref:phosphoribosylanthranilate isomerase n=1 Tax=Novosphingobium sp. CF614 TaxID=1884364 RepID=UPI0008E9CF85|nr:phosphoribosylanthranilate isomerase [Novosphingobium sp. CF614]SFG24652.1 phosphoribosylanthranilate isomerase [Novosphingobium sp. CF614]
MTTPAIKICGLTTPDAVDAVVKARADFAGLVFHPPSPRHLKLDAAAALAARAQGHVRRVGLFVDADDAVLGETIAATGIDLLQLQGSETPARVAQVKARFGLPVWKALPIAARADLDRAAAYAEVADMVLLDAKTPKGALPGGLGLSFDWSLLVGWKAPCPWGLAGGLAPGNVAEAIRLTGAPLVDVSSGVQSSPAVKDPAKIAAFCAAVRGA